MSEDGIIDFGDLDYPMFMVNRWERKLLVDILNKGDINYLCFAVRDLHYFNPFKKRAKRTLIDKIAESLGGTVILTSRLQQVDIVGYEAMHERWKRKGVGRTEVNRQFRVTWVSKLLEYNDAIRNS